MHTAKKSVIPFLDSLRFLAAFAVMAAHLRGFYFVDFSSLSPDSQNLFSKIFFAVTRLDHESVLIFFVLSGFLVLGPLINGLKMGQFNPRVYAVNRLARIYPPLLIALLFATLVGWYVEMPVSGSIWVINFFGLQGVLGPSITAPFWSLAYEMWFYVLAGAFGLLITSKAKSLTAWILIISSACVFNQLNLVYLLIWVLGGVFYALDSPIFDKRGVRLFSGFFLLAATLLTQLASDSKTGFTIWNGWNSSVVEIIFALASCLFIRCLKSFRPVNTLRLIDEKIAPLAVFSYTLYLIHYSIGYLYRFYFPNKHQVVDLGYFLGYRGLLVVSTLVCFAVYQLGERHTAFFKRKWDQILPQR